MLLLASACSSSVSEPNDTPIKASDVTEKENPIHDNESSSESIQTIIVSAFEMGYKEEKIHLKQGEEYKLILKNDGIAFHDLTVDKMPLDITFLGEMDEHPVSLFHSIKSFFTNTVYAHGGNEHEEKEDDKKEHNMDASLHLNVSSGNEAVVQFIPKEKGEYRFYCTVEGHEEMGMVGTFIVE